MDWCIRVLVGQWESEGAVGFRLHAGWYLLTFVSLSAGADVQYSGHMSSLFFEEIYCFFLKKCNLNTPPGKLIFSNIFRRSIFLFQRYHYFVIGIQLMFIQ